MLSSISTGSPAAFLKTICTVEVYPSNGLDFFLQKLSIQRYNWIVYVHPYFFEICAHSASNSCSNFNFFCSSYA